MINNVIKYGVLLILLNIVRYIGKRMLVKSVDEIVGGIWFICLSRLWFCVVIRESKVYSINVLMVLFKW